jgi:hypothetical protein
MKPEMERMNASALRDKSVLDPEMNAVILYDRIDFETKANAILERVAHRMDEPKHWSVKPWRVDMLKLPSADEAALAEAAEGHLIVLAPCQIQSLFPWLAVIGGRSGQDASKSEWEQAEAGISSHPRRLWGRKS